MTLLLRSLLHRLQVRKLKDLFNHLSLKGLIFRSFETLQKATTSFVMSVRPSVSFSHRSTLPQWTYFHEILIFPDFSKICREYSSVIKITH